jgi:nucleotide-binding universal stress UspA family protein
MQEEAQRATRRRLEELTANVPFAVEPQFRVEFGEPSDGILHAASSLHVEGIIMGLNQKTRIKTISHPRSTAYKVACGATCPVLTVRD